MQVEKISLDETDCFSSQFIDYIKEKPALKPFYDQFPTVDNFRSTIENRKFSSEKRSILVAALKSQYQNVQAPKAVTDNIELLGDQKTFTVTTGHQLNILTGPLYFIYKIVTTINACKTLKQAYPAYNFVPIYWMASEDHDFDEINHFYFEGKKFQWDTDQTGAVGKFDPSELKEIVDQLPHGAAFFKEAYDQPTLAAAARHYVNHLLGEQGIVVVDADSTALKKLFTPIIEDDLFSHSAEGIVNDLSNQIEEQGYKTQVHCRQINFFYHIDSIRERIERDGDTFSVLNTEITFSDVELREEIKTHPERFSPNVILRPLYQETILPNLAYIGGPSEAIYWLQLKTMFEHFKTPFPLLIPRNFALVIPKNAAHKWSKTKLSYQDLFADTHKATAKWIKQNTANDLSYQDEISKLREVYKALSKKAETIDPTLQKHLEALKTAAEKKLVRAEKKLVRAEKRKHSDKENQINEVHDVLFPGGSLQERRDNFLNFHLNDSQFIQSLLDTFDAFDYRMYLLLLDH